MHPYNLNTFNFDSGCTRNLIDQYSTKICLSPKAPTIYKLPNVLTNVTNLISQNQGRRQAGPAVLPNIYQIVTNHSNVDKSLARKGYRGSTNIKCTNNEIYTT